MSWLFTVGTVLELCILWWRDREGSTIVQEVRRDEGLEPWPRFLERDVDVSEDEVFDLSLDGLDRFSDSVRWESILTGQGGPTASTMGLSVLRRRDGAVLL
jgi:hypothetical protein